MANIRSLYRTGIFAAATLAICGITLSSALAAETCTGSLAQYGATIKQLETFSAKAQAQADLNPLYIADVEYYASALAQAQRCAKNLGNVATVSR
jgi:hypothetical protein